MPPIPLKKFFPSAPHFESRSAAPVIYTITWLLCAFSLVVTVIYKGHTHRWRRIHVRSRRQQMFSFFTPQKFFNEHLNFYCKEQQSHHSTSFRVVLFCSLHAVTSSVIYYSTHTWKNVIYLLNLPRSAQSLRLKGLKETLSFWRTFEVIKIDAACLQPFHISLCSRDIK